MNNRNDANATTPWYRQFWPWFIIAILSWGVVSASITLSFALRNPPQMMTGDYQRLGKALVDTHKRADRAEALGLSGAVQFEQGEWRLVVETGQPGALGDVLLLLVQHPTDAERDRQVLLRGSVVRGYTGAGEPPPGRGRLIVSDPEQSWWISSAYQAENNRLAVDLRPERL